MPEQSGPFEVEPRHEPQPDETVGGGTRAPDDTNTRAEPKGRIDAESLLEGFEEDADFSVDPEVEAAAEATHDHPPKPDRSDEAELGDPSRWLIGPGFPSANASLVGGTSLALAAALISIVNHADGAWWLHGFETLYATALNTLLGLFALVSAAYFSQRGLNEPLLGLARIFVAVAGAMAAMSLELPFGLSVLLGGAAYYLLAIVCFRLPKYEINVLAISHAGLWLLVRIGIELGARVAANSP